MFSLKMIRNLDYRSVSIHERCPSDAVTRKLLNIFDLTLNCKPKLTAHVNKNKGARWMHRETETSPVRRQLRVRVTAKFLRGKEISAFLNYS